MGCERGDERRKVAVMADGKMPQCRGRISVPRNGSTTCHGFDDDEVRRLDIIFNFEQLGVWIKIEAERTSRTDHHEFV